MGQDQNTLKRGDSARSDRRLRPRACLRKGCEQTYQPLRWNQRYCQDPECLRLVRRWQAARRQRRRRQHAEHRERHCQAERQRRRRCREQATDRRSCQSAGSEPNRPSENAGAWSRSNGSCGSFCDRPGCYDPVRCSCRAQGRYCSEACGRAMRRVLDRERKWLRRNTYVGRFKRQLEYEQRRRRRAAEPPSLARL